jgi:hypothetical protein
VLRERGCGAVAPYSVSESKREREGGREREMPRGEKLREAPDKDKAHAHFIKKTFYTFYFCVNG